MYCCNCVCVHVCMCTCADVLLQWCQWCLCVWAYVHIHIMHVCMCCCVVVLVHVACASVYPSHLLHLHTCVITHMKKAHLSKKHAVHHYHAVLTFKQDTCILKQALTMLACSADTAMAKKGHSKLLKHVEHEIDISLPTGPSSHRSSCRLGNLLWSPHHALSIACMDQQDQQSLSCPTTTPKLFALPLHVGFFSSMNW